MDFDTDLIKFSDHDRLQDEAVKGNLQLDWFKKESAKAAIRLAVKKELRGKVDIKELNAILAEIMEQAEGQYSDWPRVG